MKTTVLLNKLEQAELRPREYYNEYSRLISEDVRKLLFPGREMWTERRCPGCTNADVKLSFERNGFQFYLCDGCFTLYVSPVPDQAALSKFRAEGQAERYLDTLFRNELSSKRYIHIIASIIAWVMTYTDRFDLTGGSCCVWSSHGARIAEIMKRKNACSDIVVVNGNEIMHREDNPVNTVESIRDISKPKDVMALFDLLERMVDPRTALFDALGKVNNGGMVFITCATYGFEYQVLKEHSPNLIPVDRLTLFSADALKRILRESGFEVLELSTPGRLDVEVVVDTVKKRGLELESSFLENLLIRKDENCLSKFQLFLQEFCMSSYLRVAARKA